MNRILITGAGGSAAFNFHDSLKQSKADYFIAAADMKPYHLDMMPVAAKFLVPGVKDPGYVDAINRIVAAEQIDFIHPQPDVEVAFWAKAENQAKVRATFFLPLSEVVEACHDKMAFNQILTAKGVPVPKAHHIGSPQDLKAALEELLQLQPKIWLRATRGAGSRASLPINSFYQGDAWIDYWRTFRGVDYGDFMASEFLPGPEFAWQSLWHRGQLVTAQARERLEYIFGNLTPSGQTSSPSVAKTVNRDDINEVGQSAVRAISAEPHGVFCVDMKEDANGFPKVTEINPGRFFTTSNFFAHAGSNMPAMYLELGQTGQLRQKPPRLNPLPENLYWVRMIDMGFKLVKDGEWSSRKI